MAWTTKEDKKKESLIKRGKELGLNLDKSMSVYDIENQISEAEGKEKPEPKPQPSSRRGEY